MDQTDELTQRFLYSSKDLRLLQCEKSTGLRQAVELMQDLKPMIFLWASAPSHYPWASQAVFSSRG